jgi:hypothetical protein
MKITDSKIVDWLETNVGNILIHRSYDPPLSYFGTCNVPPARTTYQRVVRKGLAGQNIYSEREYTSIREMAADALKGKQ